jgi:hypothetical protein
VPTAPERRYRGLGIASLALAAVTSAPLGAHRLDEYLQAAQITISREALTIEIFLTPGVLVAPGIIADIDRDANGGISPNEANAYAQRLLAFVTVSQDTQPVALRLVNTQPVAPSALATGNGTMRVTTEAVLAATHVGKHELVFENRFGPKDSVYLANAMLPLDESIAIVSQTRTPNQSTLAIGYEIRPAWPWTRVAAWTAGTGVVMGLGVFVSRRRAHRRTTAPPR